MMPLSVQSVKDANAIALIDGRLRGRLDRRLERTRSRPRARALPRRRDLHLAVRGHARGRAGRNPARAARTAPLLRERSQDLPRAALRADGRLRGHGLDCTPLPIGRGARRDRGRRARLTPAGVPLERALRARSYASRPLTFARRRAIQAKPSDIARLAAPAK